MNFGAIARILSFRKKATLFAPKPQPKVYCKKMDIYVQVCRLNTCQFYGQCNP